MNSTDFLLWVRGPGLNLALGIFIFGMVIKMLEIFLPGRRQNLAATRSSGILEGLHTVFSRSIPKDRSTLKRTLFPVITGYAFHLGLLIVIFLLTPHIQVFEALTGLSWPALPTPLVDLSAIITIIALMALLWRRLTHPVLKTLSTGEDYLVWLLTFLPLLTGYLAYHHLLLPYTWMLALHILSVELLLTIFPFTKLSHAFTLFIARWYNGMMAGEKGVQS